MPLVAGIIALATATVAFLALVSGGGVTPQTASAATVLRASARALDRSGPVKPLDPGQYFYTKELVQTRYVDRGPPLPSSAPAHMRNGSPPMAPAVTVSGYCAPIA